MVVNIREDLSKLVTVNELYINRLFNKAVWCISDYIEKALLSGENSVEIDFGFGTVTIIIEDTAIKYRFKPSKELEETIIDTVVNEQNKLTLTIEKNLAQKLTNIYKDLC